MRDESRVSRPSITSGLNFPRQTPSLYCCWAIMLLMWGPCRSFQPSAIHGRLHHYIIYRLPTTIRRSATSSSTQDKNDVPYPRAAVSCVVRYNDKKQNNSNIVKYCLVQRGTEPNKGLWSLPGGKLNLGETTLDGGKRELQEECCLDANVLKWYPYPFCVSDSIHKTSGNDGEAGAVRFHYCIAQCFAQAPEEYLIVASDDAADAKWMSLPQIFELVESNQTTWDVWNVIERAESWYQKGIFDDTAYDNGMQNNVV